MWRSLSIQQLNSMLLRNAALNRKILFLGCVYAVSVMGLCAAGKKDIDTRTPEKNESWTESFDVSAKKKGKYNVLVTAEDTAGNTGMAGPFNMYIDPRSDLPIAFINNPLKNMCITGSLNVSGTCFDDDDVDHVEVALDGGEAVRADGKQFWSYSFETDTLEEGAHQVAAWGIDINGVKGEAYTVVFHFNRHTPEVTVTNVEPGALLSGRKMLAGTVKDGNGVKQLLYSLDNGSTYLPLTLKHDKKNNVSRFKLTIDTRSMSDGPLLCWFKAIDKLGFESISTFLYFIDNTPPVVDFSYPPESEPCGSVFSIAGSASDTVSLESLSWKMGRESGSFELIKGNPYWTKEFDVSKSSGKSQTIEITAKDAAGNTTKVKRRISIDKTKNLPQAEITLPTADSIEGSKIYFAGTIKNVTGPAEIRYKLDKNGEQSLPVPLGIFGIDIDGLTAGKHTLTVYAVNAQGIKGPAQTVSFTSMGAKPAITLEKKGSAVFVQTISPKKRMPVSITVTSENGLASVSYAVGSGSETPAVIKHGASNTVIKIPSDTAFTDAVTPITVSAADIYGQTSRQTILVELQDSNSALFLWAQSTTTSSGAVIMSPDTPLTGVYHPAEGTEIATVTVEGDSSAFTVSHSGSIITLTALSSGSYQNVRVTVTDSAGTAVTSEGIDILVDNGAPAITLEGEAEPRPIKSDIELKGTVSDDAGVASVSYTVGSTVYEGLSPSFTRKIEISDLPDGLIMVGVHATDAIGNKTSEYRIFYKALTGPQVSMIFPKEGDKVNGSILTGFTVADPFLLEKAEYKAAGSDSAWEPMDISSIISRLIGSAADPIGKGMQFRFTDKIGNGTVYNDYHFEIDEEADKPHIDVHVPAEDEILVRDFDLSGMVYDDDGVSKIFYQIDDQPAQAIETAHNFSIPFKISDFSDNEHTISLYAEDIYGVKSNVFKRKVRISLSIPSGTIESPGPTEMVKDMISIKGTASDKNGIAAVAISLDNGNTYNKAEGADSWHYNLNTHGISDGTYVLFVKLLDTYGQESIISSLITIDNTPPEMLFEYPFAGGKYDAVLPVSGQVHDMTALQTVSLTIKGLQGQTVPSHFTDMVLPHNLLVSQRLDISECAEGFYNLEVRGIDQAGNVTNVARNFEITHNTKTSKIELLYPLDGETVTGEFNFYGQIGGITYPESVTLVIDGREHTTGAVSPTGYFNFRLTPEDVTEGIHKLSVQAVLEKGNRETSVEHTVIYKPLGPWVTIDNFAVGDFAVDRPYLRGTAGYSLSDAEKELLGDKSTPVEVRTAIQSKRVAAVEISFNNGKTFKRVRTKKEAWRYRLETGDMTEGNHFILVRATMANNEVAVCRTIVSVDKTAPKVRLITPTEGGIYNEAIIYAGFTSDNVNVASVNMALRKGDKFLYEVPKAFRGLHFELGLLGATLWNMGFGLSFFDSNVKIQLHYGQMLSSQWNAVGSTEVNQTKRYGGHVFSTKILANIFELPFASFAGPDFAWLYMTGALGANFSIFTETQSKKAQVLSAMIAQLEFPRVKLSKKKVKYFNSFAFYTEGQLWFIPTDVTGPATISVLPRISIGFRAEVF